MNYHKNHEYIASTLLKQYDKSPLKAKAYIEGDVNTDTPAMMIGRVFHEMMDGSETFIIFDPENRPEPTKTFGSKLNKEWKDSIYTSGKDVVSIDEYNNLANMVSSITASKFYNKLLGGVKLESKEKGYYTEVAGCKIKCKPDALYEGANDSIICVDWKSTSEKLTADRWQYNRVIKKYGYDLSAVHYSEVLYNHFKKDVHFFLLFVESAEPYDVMPVYINRQGEMYQQTFDRWIAAVQGLTKCLTTGEWPTIESQVNNYIEF